MTGRKLLLLIAVAATVLVGGSHAQFANGPPVWGFVFSQSQGRPVGGITISLVHPQMGRSSPAFSASNGYFFFANVPPSNTQYYIEAYWGMQLLYRGMIMYQGGSRQFNIQIP
jgi:hypothetical protein